MSDEQDDDLNDELPEKVQALVDLIPGIDGEAADMASTHEELSKLLGGASSPTNVAILRIAASLDNSVIPMIKEVAVAAAEAIIEVLNEIEPSMDSQLTREDAELITAPFLGLIQIMAKFEVTASEEEKKLCQQIGEASVKALARIKEITMVEDEEDEKDDDKESN